MNDAPLPEPGPVEPPKEPTVPLESDPPQVVEGPPGRPLAYPFRWLVIFSLLVGVVFDALCLRYSRGLNVALLTLVFLAAGLWPLMRREGARQIPWLETLLFSVMGFNLFTQSQGPVDQALIPLYLITGVLFFTSARNNLIGFDIKSSLNPYWGRFGEFMHLLKKRFDLKNKKMNSTLNNQVALGLLCAAPVLILLIFLLSKADSGFQTFLENVLDNIANMPEHVFSIILYFSLFLFAVGTLFSATKTSDIRPISNNEFPLVSSTVFLSTIFLVLSAFFIIHLQSESPIQAINKPNYGIYIRKSFVELLAAGLLVGLSLLAVLTSKPWMEFASLKHRLLALSLNIFTAALLASCAFRLWVYISTMGLTLLRGFSATSVVAALVALVFLGLITFSPIPQYRAIRNIVYLFIVTFTLWASFRPTTITAISYRNLYQRNWPVNIYDLEVLGQDAIPYMYAAIYYKKPVDKFPYYGAQEHLKYLARYEWMEYSPGRIDAINSLESVIKKIDKKWKKSLHGLNNKP